MEKGNAMSKKINTSTSSKDMIRNSELSIEIYPNATICTDEERGGVYYNGRYIANSGYFILEGEDNKVKNWTIDKITPIKEVSNESVIYLGHMVKHYGHFLVDCVTRFWTVMNSPHLKDKKYVISSEIEYENLPDFEKDFFNALNLNNNNTIFLYKKNVEYQEVYLPEKSYLYNKYITKEYKETFRFVADKLKRDTYLEGTHPKKLYLSRLSFSKYGIKTSEKKPTRYEYGEYAVCEQFKKNGFTVLYPEEMSLAEKVEAFQGAEIIVAQWGSTAHNILWAADGIKLIVLNRYRAPNIHQEYINVIKSIQSETVDCCVSGGTRQLNCMTVTHSLIKYLKRNNLKIFLTPKLISNIIGSYYKFRIEWICNIFKDLNNRIVRKISNIYRACTNRMK